MAGNIFCDFSGMVGFFVFWGFLLVKMYFPQDSVFGRTRANIQKELYVKFVNATVASVLNSQAVAEGRTGLLRFGSANVTAESVNTANETFGWPESAKNTSEWSESGQDSSDWSELANKTSDWLESANQTSGWTFIANHRSGWSNSANHTKEGSDSADTIPD